MPVRSITRFTIVPLSRSFREWKQIISRDIPSDKNISFHSEPFLIDLILLKIKTKENKLLISFLNSSIYFTLDLKAVLFETAY